MPSLYPGSESEQQLDGNESGASVERPEEHKGVNMSFYDRRLALLTYVSFQPSQLCSKYVANMDTLYRTVTVFICIYIAVRIEMVLFLLCK